MQQQRGFTLLEVMVVIVILGIIASMVVPNLLENKEAADQQKAMVDIQQLEAALDRLLNNNFDVDSKETIVTLLKIIDNVISKPGDPKVRTLKLSNAVMQKKIVSRQGAGRCSLMIAGKLGWWLC